MNYRAYIKDCLELNERPKAIIPIQDGNYSEDLLSNATASFDTYETVPKEIQNGDVFCLFKPNGKVVYQGIITSIEDKTINCDQILSILRGSWFYILEEKDYLEQEIANVISRFMKHQVADLVTTLPTANYENWKLRKLYLKKNGSKYEQYYINRLGNGSDKEPYKYSLDRLGKEASDGSSGFEPYDLTEAQYKTVTDDLMIRKYNQFTINYEGSQRLHLTASDTDHEVIEMEDFIYSLYESYGVVVEINIPYDSGCTITVKTPSYDSTKIAMNSKSILSIAPRKETAEYNKLVIMYSNGAYRASYYATPNGIVDSDESTDRLPVVNTKIVFSDDELEDIKYENLKDEIYNHEINFEMYFDSNLYDWESWKLGMPLSVYYKEEVYNSYFTGYSSRLSKDSHTVNVTCGIVRSKLTDKIKKKTSTSSKNGSNAKVGGSGLSDVTTKTYVDEGNTAVNDRIDGLATVASTGSYNDLSNKPNVTNISGFGAGKTLKTLTETDGKIAATFQDISITKSQISDFPTIPAAVAVKGNAESSYRTGNVNLTPANIGAVNKAGDTMTGALTVQNKNIIVKETDITKDTTPSSNTYGQGFYLTDSAGGTLGFVRPLSLTNGNEGVYFGTTRTVGDSSITNALYMYVASNGDYRVGVSNAAAWRSGIDAAQTSHTHGNITSDGDMTATAAIASGDRLVINDESASKLTSSSLTFGSSTTTFLANNGTWKTPSGTIAGGFGGIDTSNKIATKSSALKSSGTTTVSWTATEDCLVIWTGYSGGYATSYIDNVDVYGVSPIPVASGSVVKKTCTDNNTSLSIGFIAFGIK